MRILIVDDHAIVRAGVKQILADALQDLVVGEAEDGKQAVGAALNEAWDLAIVDISMPGRSGLDVLKQFRELRPQMPVLMFSMHAEEQYAVRTLRAGAAGYLVKASLSGELTQAVHKILNGGRYVSSELAERLAYEVGAPAQGPAHEALSDRELEILCLIGAGRSVKEIAGELSLSVNTVSTYRGRILDKMNMANTAELIRYVVENRLGG